MRRRRRRTEERLIKIHRTLSDIRDHFEAAISAEGQNQLDRAPFSCLGEQYQNSRLLFNRHGISFNVVILVSGVSSIEVRLNLELNNKESDEKKNIVFWTCKCSKKIAIVKILDKNGVYADNLFVVRHDLVKMN